MFIVKFIARYMFCDFVYLEHKEKTKRKYLPKKYFNEGISFCTF